MVYLMVRYLEFDSVSGIDVQRSFRLNAKGMAQGNAMQEQIMRSGIKRNVPLDDGCLKVLGIPPHRVTQVELWRDTEPDHTSVDLPDQMQVTIESFG
jgi:hypothetical protein